MQPWFLSFCSERPAFGKNTHDDDDVSEKRQTELDYFNIDEIGLSGAP